MKTYYFEIEMTDESVLRWSGLTKRTAEDMYNKMATSPLGNTNVRSYEWGEEEEDRK